MCWELQLWQALAQLHIIAVAVCTGKSKLPQWFRVHNIITAIIDLQQAFYWHSGHASTTIFNFLTIIRTLPSWGESSCGVH
jgi:hypothetical protein